MKKEWVICAPDKTLTDRIRRLSGCHPVVAAVLANRHICEKAQIDAFLRPCLSHIRSFSLLTDMTPAVERIAHALGHKQKILIFGDYDVDGITSTVLIYEFLQQAGADVRYYIPHRIDEGYGLAASHVREIAAEGQIDLIITVDCGSASHEAIACATACNIDVIITDHHDIPAPLPAAHAVINPKRIDCTSKSDHLAGVGVAFCLAIALRKHLRECGYFNDDRPEPNLKSLCDLVALGTISDIVPLVAENRVLTHAGLQVINSAPRPGIAALIESSGIRKPFIDAEDIAFRLGPRLNAAGRMDHADSAVNLLLTRDIDQARVMASSLNEMNSRRQQVEGRIFQNILMFLNEKPEFGQRKSIVLGAPDWHAGVLGIVASRLVEHLHRPVVLFSFKDGGATGSARSIPSVNMHEALTACADLLEGYGGHAMAAGLRLKAVNFEPFRAAFERQAAKMIAPDDLAPTLIIDAPLSIEDIDDRLTDEIESLQPFGPLHPEPLFYAKDLEILFSKEIGSRHCRYIVKPRHSTKDIKLPAIWFNAGADGPIRHQFASMAFKLRWNHWNGKRAIQLIIEDVR